MKESITAKNPYELAEALGLPRSEAVVWEAKYQLSKRIIKNFKTKKLSRAKIAKKSGVSVSEIAKILKFGSCKVETLLKVLFATGDQAEFKFLKAT